MCVETKSVSERYKEAQKRTPNGVDLSAEWGKIQKRIGEKSVKIPTKIEKGPK